MNVLIVLAVLIAIMMYSNREGYTRIETKESCKSQGLEFDPVDDKCVKPIK